MVDRFTSESVNAARAALRIKYNIKIFTLGNDLIASGVPTL